MCLNHALNAHGHARWTYTMNNRLRGARSNTHSARCWRLSGNGTFRADEILMPRGVCKPCRQEKDLQNSHLIPAAIIRQLREPSLDNPNPIIVTGKVAVQSPRPIKDYVLCNVCEGLFSKKGEMWAIGNMARDDKFLLFDALEKSKPIAADHEIAVYAGRRSLKSMWTSLFTSR